MCFSTIMSRLRSRMKTSWNKVATSLLPVQECIKLTVVILNNFVDPYFTAECTSQDKTIILSEHSCKSVENLSKYLMPKCARFIRNTLYSDTALFYYETLIFSFVYLLFCFASKYVSHKQKTHKGKLWAMGR